MPKPKRDLPKNTTIRPSTKLLLFVRQEVERRGETLKEDWTQAELLDEFYDAWERERLKQTVPIGENSSPDSLTQRSNFVTISVRAEEKEWVERLLVILRSGHADAIQKITSSIGIHLRKLEETRDAGPAKPKGETVPGRA